MSEPAKQSNRALDLVDGAVGWLARLGCLAVLALVVMTGVGVFFRYILRDPINSLGDIIGLTLSLCVACSLAYGGRRGAHVAVDVLNMVGGRTVTRWTDIIVRVLGIAIIVLLCRALINNGVNSMLYAFISSSLGISHEYSYYAMTIGFAAYGVVLLVELIVGLMNFWADVDPSEKVN